MGWLKPFAMRPYRKISIVAAPDLNHCDICQTEVATQNLNPRISIFVKYNLYQTKCDYPGRYFLLVLKKSVFLSPVACYLFPVAFS
jgi:hypothetical protein